MDMGYLTVTQITAQITQQINPNFKRVYVRGELSNTKLWRSGHLYFDLKDENSKIHCVMYHAGKRLKFQPKDGMNVLISGRIEVYKKNGYYQLYANKITEEGIGELLRAYEQLKEKLEKEGLFDKTHKKEIPEFPQRIGVITSDKGKAIKDIITTVKRRWHLCEIILFPSLVQGEGAAQNITRQIRKSADFNLDVVIIGRGGGSIEDLWAFNDETLARAIYNCDTPIISAVGHDTDYTIADFVCDKRASTPTAAAELAVPDIKNIKNNLKQLNVRTNTLIKNLLNSYERDLKSILDKNLFKNPDDIYAQKEMMLDNLVYSLNHLSNSLIKDNESQLKLIKNSYIFKNPISLYDEKNSSLNSLVNRLKNSSDLLIKDNENQLNIIKNSYIFKNPDEIYKSGEIRFDNLKKRLINSFLSIIKDNENKLDAVKNRSVLKNPERIIDRHLENYLIQFSRLELLNPLDTLKRGYTLAKLEGKVISSSKQLNKGDEFEVEFSDGSVNTKVI